MLTNFFAKIKKTFKKPILPSSYTKDYFVGCGFEIGQYTYGVPKVYFSAKNSGLRIGNFCSIAGEVTILLGGNHRYDWVTTYPFPSIYLNEKFQNFKLIENYNISRGIIEIGNDVWIGYGATILSGVSIGNGAVIAAYSLVSKDVGPYEIWGGNPAKMIKKRFTDDQIEALEKIRWWDWKIEKINRYAFELCSPDIGLFINKAIKDIL